jgi:hypothetical protein
MWAMICLVACISVCVSTYLSGPLSFLVTAIFVGAGYARPFIETVARGGDSWGGPAESLNRLLRGDIPTAQLDPTATVQAARAIDATYEWFLRRFMNFFPDVDRFDWGAYVQEGFNVPLPFLVLNVVVLFAYLLPWGILGYYLMKSREVATW